MKKNRMMRLASALLVAVLLTTCAISGTFAKYVTTASASDTARVAKWGVTVTATGDDAFAQKYNNAADNAGTQVVSRLTLAGAEGGEASNVVAPGTYGTLASLDITGKPEVVVNVAVTADLNLGDTAAWTINCDHDNNPATPNENVLYCPIVFTVGSDKFALGTTYTTLAALEAAIEAKFTALSEPNVPANTDLSAKDITVGWEWAYESGADDAAKAITDICDTALGDKAVLPTIEFTYSASVTQVD